MRKPLKSFLTKTRSEVEPPLVENCRSLRLQSGLFQEFPSPVNLVLFLFPPLLSQRVLVASISYWH